MSNYRSTFECITHIELQIKISNCTDQHIYTCGRHGIMPQHNMPMWQHLIYELVKHDIQCPLMNGTNSSYRLHWTFLVCNNVTMYQITFLNISNSSSLIMTSHWWTSWSTIHLFINDKYRFDLWITSWHAWYVIISIHVPNHIPK